MASPYTGLVSGGAHLLDNDKFSDLKIKCDDHQISAHKLIICTPSDVLDAMCTAGFQETKSNTIDLSTDTKRVVYRMVEFLYRADYQQLDHPDYITVDTSPADRSGPHHALLHAAMYAAADKYNIPALTFSAVRKFVIAINTLPFTDAHFLSVIEHIYNTTPDSDRGLRDVIVLETQTRGSRIMADAVLNARLEEMTSSVPQFAWDMIQKSLQPAPTMKRCDGCKAEVKEGGSCEECAKKGFRPRFPDPSVFNTPDRRARGLF